MHKIRTGDQVVVLAGRDRGKRGTVKRVLPEGRLLVENVNLVKRHTRPNPARNVTGGVIEKESPIHVSNVALYNAAGGRGARVGFRQLADGRKVRYFKKGGEVVDA